MILDPIINNKIKEQYEILLASSEVLPDEKLTEYYETFRKKFGPDRLSSLDGEELLNYMHNSTNRDSLVYWLEFKNDDEYPNRFGSIAGGSALKFGIYRRRETGGWVTGSPQSQVQLTVEQAVQIARKHREQLLVGVKLLEGLPRNASDAQYVGLQHEMNQLAPDICNTTWGHKYFSMLFPDKLDDFHAWFFQRFYLIKMLQIPIAPEGRFAVAGQYMRIARELGIHVNNLTRILLEIFGGPHRYWAIKANYADKRWKNWELMRDHGFVGIGWGELGDLSEIRLDQESRSKVKTLMRETYKEKGGYAQEVFNFVATLVEGDIVVATEGGSEVLGVGRVVGNYYYEDSTGINHRHAVSWLLDKPWKLPENEPKARVVRQLSSMENLVEIEKQILGLSIPLPSPGPIAVRRQPFAGVVARINDILERKRQVILYGPPGTGKTYWAQQAAKAISGNDPPSEDFPEEYQAKGSTWTNTFIRLCTFHPSYGYEDFIEGYKPVSRNGVLTFELRAGVFKAICQDAHAQPDRKFFLIIDEINRGDIPRIFGELLTILERDKRGQSLLLPVSGEAFSVPDNVYIIGTMNTADRSIALLDTALRRRFGFVELMPDTSALGATTLANSIPLGPWLGALNLRVLEFVGRDARNLQIGHAYLMEKGKPYADFGRFVRVLQDDIIPLLEEYCYEDYDALEKILGKGLVDREKQRIRHELFESSRQADLIQALLEPSPEITASPAAIQQDQIAETNDEEIDE